MVSCWWYWSFNLSADDEVRFKPINFADLWLRETGGALHCVFVRIMSRARDFADLGSSVDTGGKRSQPIY